MDRVKSLLAQVKRHHFWLLCCIASLAGLVGWYLSTADLSKKFALQKKTIEAEFMTVRALTTAQNHPNGDWIEGVEAATDKRKEQVAKVWNDVYQHQKKEVLLWPENLGADFISIVQSLGPTDDIPVGLRERYQNYIKNEFPQLLKIIDAEYYNKPTTDLQGAPGGKRLTHVKKPAGAAADAGDDDHDYRVVWEHANQQEIEDSLDWPHTPTAQEVRNAQENLWVYHTLLQIIANVNKHSTGHHNAKIKDLKELAVGSKAAMEFQTGMASGHIMLPVPAAGATGTPSHGEASIARSGAQIGAAGVGSHKDADDGRYVNDQGVPARAEEALSAEFRRMPVSLRLIIDQREIAQLLVECANASLPVEVRQLRINPSAGGSRGLGGGAVAASGHMDFAAAGAGSSKDEMGPYDVPIDLQGIIYIFNPPDRSKLKKSNGDEPVIGPEADAKAVAPVNAKPRDDAADASAATRPGTAAQ